MLKVRITFIDDGKHDNEVRRMIADVQRSFTIVNQSNIYKGRGGSKYSNIYIDIEKKSE